MLDLILIVLLLVPKAFFHLLAYFSSVSGLSGSVPSSLSFIMGKFLAALTFIDPLFPADRPGSVQFMDFVASMLSLFTWTLIVWVIMKIVGLFRGTNITPHD